MRVRAAALATVLVLGSAGVGGFASAAAADPLTATSVTVTILGVTPTTPLPSNTPAPLTVRLQLTNTTDQTLTDVQVTGDRGDPINSEQGLDAAIAKPVPGDPNLVSPINPLHGKPVQTSIAAKGTVTVDFVTTTSVRVGADTGICLCHSAIYPLYFQAHNLDAAGNDTVVGAAQTYIPAFGLGRPAPVRVSWVWPIIDRPHRLLGDTTFLDDDLATSVSVGRLDRVLQVLEDVGGAVPMTVVIDPELIDELAVMSTGKYTVQSRSASGKIVNIPGIGQAAAAAWLARLRAALAARPDLDVQATPFADPNVDALAQNSLSWSVDLPAAGQARVRAALGGRVLNTTFSWPVSESLSPARAGCRPGRRRDDGAAQRPRTARRAAHAQRVRAGRDDQRHVDRGRHVLGHRALGDPGPVHRRRGHRGPAQPGRAGGDPRCREPEPSPTTSSSRHRGTSTLRRFAAAAILDTARTYWSAPLHHRGRHSQFAPVDRGQPNPNVRGPALPAADRRRRPAGG